jgi:hypothetical protein
MPNLFPYGTGEEGDETGEAYREMIRNSNERVMKSSLIENIKILYSKTSVKCNVCGTPNLRWKKHDTGKYWLTDKEDVWHTCTEE